jgi:hypothetical protein
MFLRLFPNKFAEESWICYAKILPQIFVQILEGKGSLNIQSYKKKKEEKQV